MEQFVQEKFAEEILEMNLKFRHILRENCKMNINENPVTLTNLIYASVSEIYDAQIDYEKCYRREILGFSFHNDRLLFENISTNDINRIKKRLKTEYKIKDWQIEDIELYNKIDGIIASTSKYVNNKKKALNLIIPSIKKNREIIINVLRQEGYYLINETPVELIKGNNILWVVLQFAPYEQKDVRDLLKESTWLFHSTSVLNSPNISKDGLVPTESDGIFKYQSRIYLWNETDIERATEYCKQIYSYTFDKLSFDANPNYCIYRIDAQAVINNMEIYHDPLIQDAFFVVNRIGPKFIDEFRIVNANRKPLYRTTEKRKLIEHIAKENDLKYSSINCAIGGFNKKEELELLKDILDDNQILYSKKIYHVDDQDFLIVIE